MQITTLAELESAKKLVLEMKSNTVNAFVISVYDTMLEELEKGDLETPYTPSYFSICNFGYDIFSILPKMRSR